MDLIIHLSDSEYRLLVDVAAKKRLSGRVYAEGVVRQALVARKEAERIKAERRKPVLLPDGRVVTTAGRGRLALTESDILRIPSLYERGMSDRQISQLLNCSNRTIGRYRAAMSLPPHFGTKQSIDKKEAS